MNRLIKRFCFSLLAVGLLLGYMGYETYSDGGSHARAATCYVAAVACISLGWFGLDGRYRRND